MKAVSSSGAPWSLLIVCLMGASCHGLLVTPLDARAACAGAICATPLEVDVDAYVLDLDAPTGAALRQVVRRGPRDVGAPCASGVPVAEVVIDGARIEHGPARVGSRHRLRLRFGGHDSAAPASATDHETLELELADGGRVACVAVPIIRRRGP
jgi:hypothetical protein